MPRPNRRAVGLAACEGKTKFGSQALAEQVAVTPRAKRAYRRKPPRLYTYQCGECGCWHLTSMDPRTHARIVAIRAARTNC